MLDEFRIETVGGFRPWTADEIKLFHDVPNGGDIYARGCAGGDVGFRPRMRIMKNRKIYSVCFVFVFAILPS
jgi:hypothetical protein